MATTNLKAYTQSATNLLTTETNSLANNAITAASSAVDNTSNLDLFMDLELILAAQGSARSAGALVAVYLAWSLDGTNYDDVVDGLTNPVATFPLDAATTARRISPMTAQDIPLRPGLFKAYLKNITGQAFAASGTSVRYRTRSITTA